MSWVSGARPDFLTLRQKKYFLLFLLFGYLSLCFVYSFLPGGAVVFPWYLALYTAHFVVYGGLLWLLRYSQPNLIGLLAVAILARVILLPSDPILENDYWRYLWDGRVLAHGINPYSYKPLEHALDHLDVFYRQQIGWKQYGTIYPPVSIMVFAISHLVAPDSLLGLKLVLIIFELATGAVVLLWLKRMNISLKWSSIYFFSPLLLKEIANSAHLDSIAVFFATLSVYLIWSSNKNSHSWVSLAGWVSLALAVASKLYPICFVPLFLKVDRWRWRGLIIFLGCLILIYGPFVGTGYNLFNGTEAFAKHWIFNASLYKVIQKGISITVLFFESSNLISTEIVRFLLQNDRLAKICAGSLFAVFVYLRAKALKNIDDLPDEVVNVLGALLILSPVVNGWYLLWLFPFACVTRNKPWLCFSFLIVAGYAWWYSRELALYLKWLEYLILFGTLYVWNIRTQKKIAIKVDI